VADQNAIVLDVRAAVGDGWDQAPAGVRSAVLARLGDYAKSLKLAELRKGVGTSGGPLAPVRYRRPDGAKGPPLSPHQADSRAQKWLRATPGSSAGTITLWWSHGWGQILGYHARGEVRGAPVRDVIGLTPADLDKFHARARREWKAASGTSAKPVAQVVGKVAYLPPGARPSPAAKTIQVYATGGRGKPPAAPRAKVVPPAPPKAKVTPPAVLKPAVPRLAPPPRPAAPVPKPAMPKAAPPPQAAAADLPPTQMAREVLAAARSVPDFQGLMEPYPGHPGGAVVGGVVGGNKVFIGHAYDAAAGRPAFVGMSLGQFKDLLVDLNRKGLVRLTRADLVEAFHPASVERSATFALGSNTVPAGRLASANFHFIRID
jgi:hypothetical protein